MRGQHGRQGAKSGIQSVRTQGILQGFSFCKVTHMVQCHHVTGWPHAVFRRRIRRRFFH